LPCVAFVFESLVGGEAEFGDRNPTGRVLDLRILSNVPHQDVLLWSHDARASDYVPQEIGIAVGCNKTILPVVMEDNVPVPGFVTNLKYLPAHKNWEGSFQWLAEFVHDNATKLKNDKVLGGLVAAILGGIWLFGDDSAD
jgi:hypothetical protein